MTIAPRDTGTFYNPVQEKEAKRRRKMAEMLMAQGQQPQQTEMVSGMAVKQSPIAGLARALTAGIGTYQGEQADKMEAEREAKRQQMLSDAISKYGTDPMATAQTLMQDPSMQEMGFKIAMDAQKSKGGPFIGDSIEAQMANALAAKGYTPDQIAQMYYTKAITLPGGGVAAVTPQDRGLPAMPSPQVAGSMGDLPNVGALAQEMGALRGDITGGVGVPTKAPTPDPMMPNQVQGGLRMLRQPDTGEVNVDLEQGRAMADALGVPYNPPNTLGLQGKALERLILAQQTAAQKQLNDPDRIDAMRKAQGISMDADRLEQLMQIQGTGGFYNIPGAKSVAGWFDPEVSEINKIQDRLTPLMRAPGSGATSDFDAKMFQNALPGMGTPKETNDAVIQGMKARAQLEQDKQLFLERYVEANGTTTGADRYWQEYVNANPIFDPNSPNTPKINKNRVKPEDFFRAKAGGDMAGAPQDVQSIQDGVTAVNPQTGERIVFRNGNWEPAQ